MTDESQLEDEANGEPRRSVLKKGALAAGGLALGSAATGGVSAQQGGEQGPDANEPKARMFLSTVHPGATFTVVSGVLDYTPETVSGLWSDYRTRVAKYQNRGVRFLFFPAQDAEIQQGQVYQIDPSSVSFVDIPSGGGGGGNDPAAGPGFMSSIVTVQLDPVGPPAIQNLNQNDYLFGGDPVRVRPNGEVVENGQVVYNAQIVHNQTGSPGFDNVQIAQGGQVINQNGNLVGTLDLGPSVSEVNPGGSDMGSGNSTGSGGMGGN